MASLEDFQPITGQRLQLLKMAQEILFHEYIDKKAQMHNKWSAEADVAWRTRGVRLPYPTFPPYPDNSMIIEKAMEMEKFLNKDVLNTSAPSTTETPQVTEPQQNKVEQPVVERPKAEEVKTERASIVPEILEKNDYFTDVGNTEPTQSNQSLFSGFFSRK